MQIQGDELLLPACKRPRKAQDLTLGDFPGSLGCACRGVGTEGNLRGTRTGVDGAEQGHLAWEKPGCLSRARRGRSSRA